MLNKRNIKKLIELPVFDRLFQYYLSFQNYRKRSHMKDERTMDMIYKVEDLSESYYKEIGKMGDRKLEHQIGRLTNFKNIIKDCVDLSGDLIEFGTWRGFSLLWIAYFMERNAILNKRLIGIDSFDGIPYTEGQFYKKQYQDTSLKRCRNNVINNNALYRETRKNILIDRFFCKEKKAVTNYLRSNGISKFCFIHLDLDVSLSTKEVFDILLEGNFIADRAYILFDDWGTETRIPEVVNSIFDGIKNDWIIQEHSSTNLTKNFSLERK